MVRTQEEIVKRFKERIKDDMLGFETDKYLFAMDYEHVKQFAKEDLKEDDWKEATKENKPIKEEMKEYMEFAIEKATDQRGISANRSIQHYIAWLWLAEEDKLLEKVEHEYKTNYHSYGIDILKMICKHFGWKYD